MSLIIGVYCLENIYNGRMYIGSSTDVMSRRNSHLCLLRKGKGHSKELQYSYDEDGEDAFLFYVIEACTKDVLRQREAYWIDNTSCLTTGFNKVRMEVTQKTIKNILTKPAIRNIHSQKTKDKISLFHKANQEKFVGSKNGKSKLNEEQVYEIKTLISKENSFGSISRRFKVGTSAISSIYSGRTWSHVKCEELDFYKKSGKNATKMFGSKNPNSKLSENDVIEIRAIIKPNYTRIGKQYGVSSTVISGIIKNKIWNNV